MAKNVDTFKINCEVLDNNYGFKLFVNGNEISTTSDIYAKSANFETSVKLFAGMNYIEVKTVDIAGNITTKIISIHSPYVKIKKVCIYSYMHFYVIHTFLILQ